MINNVIEITWKAFGDRPERNRFVRSAKVEVEFPVGTHYEKICDYIFEVTNLQDELAEFGKPEWEQKLWKEIEKVLPSDRTHTSLSVGDEVSVNGHVYRCADIGWKLIPSANPIELDANDSEFIASLIQDYVYRLNREEKSFDREYMKKLYVKFALHS